MMRNLVSVEGYRFADHCLMYTTARCMLSALSVSLCVFYSVPCCHELRSRRGGGVNSVHSETNRPQLDCKVGLKRKTGI
jgi:hypothetical protein